MILLPLSILSAWASITCFIYNIHFYPEDYRKKIHLYKISDLGRIKTPMGKYNTYGKRYFMMGILFLSITFICYSFLVFPNIYPSEKFLIIIGSIVLMGVGIFPVDQYNILHRISANCSYLILTLSFIMMIIKIDLFIKYIFIGLLILSFPAYFITIRIKWKKYDIDSILQKIIVFIILIGYLFLLFV